MVSPQVLEETSTLNAFMRITKLPQWNLCACEIASLTEQRPGLSPDQLSQSRMRRCRGLCGGLCYPSREVAKGLTNGDQMTPQQVEIIQSAVPFTLADHGPVGKTPALLYDRPLPSVFHRVIALSGSGKTTTLKLLAQAHPDLDILYVTYNTEAKESAKKIMPPNVLCATSHAMAGSERIRLTAHGKALDWPK